MNIYASLSGYLIVSLCGDHPEQVINMAMSRGIRIWDIEQLKPGYCLLKIRLGAYKALRYLVRRSSCRVRIVHKKGLPFWMMSAKRRKILVLGALFFYVALYVMGSFVWRIEVTGNQEISRMAILLEASRQGLKIGAPISGLDREAIKRQLINNLPQLAWVGLHVKGTRITIEVAEKTLPPVDDEAKPGDVVAGCAGIIEEMLILKGTPRVAEGSAVQKGQVLIVGMSYPELLIAEDGSLTPSGTPEKLRARGLVRARVTRSQIGECFIREERTLDSGAELSIILVTLGDREVIIRGPRQIPYEHYRQVRHVKSWRLGRNPKYTVELVTIINYEQRQEIRERTVDQAYQEAYRRARERLLQELPSEARILSEQHEPEGSLKEGSIRCRLVIETLEDIGVYASNPF